MNQISLKMKKKIENLDFFYIALKNSFDHACYFLNKISNNQLEKILFYKKLGYRLNLKNPRSFNEKVVWKKIYNRNPLLPVTVDKYQVRTYLKKILGKEKAEEILIPLLYVTDQPETIPFEKLPSAFIAKPNHASGLNIIVENGQFNKGKIIKALQGWLKICYGLNKLEWAYQPVKRKIIIEELLYDKNGNAPKRFKFHIFHGKCKLVRVFFDKKHVSSSHFDEKWNFLPVKMSTLPQGPKIRKPKNYKSMLALAEKIAEPFDYIRVDLYNLNGKIYFGELTHYPNSGRGRFEPNSFDFELGTHWKIEL